MQHICRSSSESATQTRNFFPFYFNGVKFLFCCTFSAFLAIAVLLNAHIYGISYINYINCIVFSYSFLENSEQSHTNSVNELRSRAVTPASISPEVLSAATIENISTLPMTKSDSMAKSQSTATKKELDLLKLSVCESERNAIENEIAELRSQLHPINEIELLKWHEDNIESVIPCTCTIKEVQNTIDETEISHEAKLTGDEKVNINAVPKKIPEIAIPAPCSQEILIKPYELNTIIAVPNENLPKKTMKSIFDLDYEDDNDPIHTFKLNNNITKNDCTQQVNLENISNKKQDILTTSHISSFGYENSIANNNELSASVSENSNSLKKDLSKTGDNFLITVDIAEDTPDQSQLQNDLISLPQITIEEDPDCKAKHVYGTTRMTVTNYHIENLHNACIPNVNGNWDNSTAMDSIPSIDQGNQNHSSTLIDKIKSLGLYERVVPLCNHISMDAIPKNLRHINFSKKKQKFAEQTEEAIVVDTNINQESPQTQLSNNITDSLLYATGLLQTTDLDLENILNVDEPSNIVYKNDETPLETDHSDNQCFSEGKNSDLDHQDAGDNKIVLDHYIDPHVNNEYFQGEYDDCDQIAAEYYDDCDQDSNLDRMDKLKSDDEADTNCPSPNNNENLLSDLDIKISKKRRYQTLKDSSKSAIQYKISNDSTDYYNDEETSHGNDNMSSIDPSTGKAKIILKLSRQFIPDCDDNLLDYTHLDSYAESNVPFCDNLLDSADESINSCEQETYEDEISNHFITLSNFPADSISNESDSTDSDDQANDDDEISSNHVCDDDSDTVNNVAIYCNPVIDEEVKSQSNSINAIECQQDSNDMTNDADYKHAENRYENDYNHSGDNTSTMKRKRTTSASSHISSRSSTNSKDAPKAKKKKIKDEWYGPCLQHYQPPSISPSLTSSDSSSDDIIDQKCAKENETDAIADDCKQMDNETNSVADVNDDMETSIDNNIKQGVLTNLEVDEKVDEDEPKRIDILPLKNNELLPSFNNVTNENETGVMDEGYKFKEWYEVVRVKSYNDELLTILPYVVID